MRFAGGGDPSRIPNLKTREIGCNLHARSGDISQAYTEYRILQRSGGEGRLPDWLHERILTGVLASPKDAISCLEGFLQAGRPLPEALRARNEDGRSMSTEWLFAKVNSLKNSVLLKGGISEALERRQREEEGMSTFEVDGVMIGQGKCAVDEIGRPISLSKMTIPEMVAELKAKGLNPDGKRKDLYKRIQQSRQSFEDDVITKMRKQEERDRKKRIKSREVALREFRTRRERLLHGQGDGKEPGYYDFTIRTWKDGQVVGEREVSYYIAHPDWYFNELFDGHPQAKEDYETYRFNRRDRNESAFERAAKTLMGTTDISVLVRAPSTSAGRPPAAGGCVAERRGRLPPPVLSG